MTVPHHFRPYRILAAWLLAGVLGALVTAGPARAQIAGGLERKGSTIEIEATEGIEWLRDQKTYIARGDAHAVSGDLAA